MREPSPRVERVAACHDPALVAAVRRCTALLYDEGPDPVLDRPAHVRAGSSLARVGDRLAVVQDDANFLALVDPASGRVRSLPLPPGRHGSRQFDDRRGNKRFKLDLEACAAVPGDGEELLIVFGSGSTPSRQQIALISGWSLPTPRVVLFDAPDVYAALRETREFAGSELNVEGALFANGRIRLFGRGNGRPSGGLAPVDATCEIDAFQLLSHLESSGRVPPPRPSAIVQVRLGTLGGLRLGFTDATLGPGVVLFSAVAEDSPDATQDGPVTGSALGVWEGPDRVRWTPVTDAQGESFGGKIEGVQLVAGASERAYVIVDRDDPDRASELCEVELSGPWFTG